MNKKLDQFLRRWVEKILRVPQDAPERWEFAPTLDMFHPILRESMTPEGFLKPDSPFVEAVEEPVPYCFHYPLFSEDYCDWLVDYAEEKGTWKFNKHDPYTAYQIYLSKFPFVNGYHRADVIGTVINDIVGGLFNWEIGCIENAFMIHYDADLDEDYRNVKMEPHHDQDTLISLSTNLNDGFEGGGLRFVRYPEIEIIGKKGWAVQFPGGNPVMTHEAMPVTDGERFVLVYWLS